MLFEELSTIPLNVKAIFHQHSDIHSFCALLFAVTFLWTRLIYGTIICFYVFRALPKFILLAEASHDTTSIALVIVQIILLLHTRLLNLYWAVLIVKKMCAKLRRHKPVIPVNKIESYEKAE